MKIAHITMSYFPAAGGQESYIIELNKIFENAGHRVTVFQPKRPFSGPKPKNVIFTPHNRFIHKLGTGFDWFWFNFMLLFYKKTLKNQDLLICHYPFHLPSIKWHSNIIVLSHGVDWPDKQKILFDKYKYKCAQFAFKNGYKIVANDTDFAEKNGKHFNDIPYFKETHRDLWIIPNCVDTNKFKFKNEKKNKIILLPRNIRKSRGIDLAIDAFNIFSKNHDDYCMLIAGIPLKGKYYNKCINLIKKYDLGKQIIFLGHQSQDDLLKLYNSSRITLIPSTAYEGTSLSALESMSCKTPVVSTKIGGLKDLPCYKSEMDPNSLANAIDFVHSNWEAESERQYQETRDTFNLHNWKAAWINAIKM